jgi:DNA polymerase-3 subunit delta'
MRFCDIPGHEDVKQRLREIVDTNRMPHALLLEGPEGTAKFALARALAQYIHCTNRHDGDSCGVCPSCRQHASFRHIDAIYSFPVVKKNSKPTISDDYLKEFNEYISENPWMDFEEWLIKLQNPNSLPRLYVEEGNALQRRLAFTAHASKYKIVLMWQPERMDESTANKMLKLVEEPFADTIFIMTSDNSRQILPTIYSRVQRIPVKRYENNVVAGWLMAQGVSDEQAAADAAMLAEGNLNRALRMLDIKSETSQHLEWFMKLMRLAYQRNIAELKQWAQTVGAEKREMLIRFLDYCCRMLRENFMFNFHNPQFNLMTDAESKFSVNFARFINERNVIKLFDAFSEASADISANANGKIVMFDLAITVILLLKN